MTSFQFERATKKAAKGRMALEGPSGSGKTFTALTFARVLGTRIAVIDTEHRSASKYADLFSFDTLGLDRYDPNILIQALAAAAQGSYDVAIIDSLSHFWMGSEGMLEQVDRAAKRAGGHGMSGWKEMRPVERAMLEAMLAYPGHVICTLRTKTDWVEGVNPRTGKPQMVKQGTKAEQREGLEYEFDIVGSLDLENELAVVKSRCPALSGQIVKKPGAQFAETFKAWLDDGEQAPTAAEIRDQVCGDPWATREQLLEVYRKAERLGLLAAMVTTDTGDTSTLGELIKAKGAEAAKRTQAADPAAEPGQEPAPAAQDDPEDRRRKRMQALLSDRGYAKRGDRLDYLSMVLVRDINSSGEVRWPREVEQVIAALERQQTRQPEPEGVPA
jgi:hypothetical protein